MDYSEAAFCGDYCGKWKEGRFVKMKLLRRVFALTLAAALLALALGGNALASTPLSRIDEALKVLREMSEQPDAQTMSGLLKSAKGVAIFPSVIKAGLILGGRYGEGLVLQRDAQTGAWYGPHFVKITGVSWGIQIGVQSTALVLVIANERGMKGFTRDKITLGGDLAVAAGPVGRQAGAGTDIELKSSIYSYSMSKGIFAGLSLEGAVIEADRSANEAYWGAATSADRALAQQAVDARILPLVQELNRLVAAAK